MKCAVCTRRVSIDTDQTYQLGELVGMVCPECAEGLGEAVRAWVVRRTRELEAEQRALDLAVEQARRTEERERERLRAEMLPQRRLRLMGVRQ